MTLPNYLKQGEAARLFPVLSTTSKEGRTTSIVLACLAQVHEFSAALLGGIGQRCGVRSTIDTFTEVVFQQQRQTIKERPDGLIVLRSGAREWRALVEAKVGNAPIQAEQVERYRALAKDNGIDCVITISNQFATNPQNHPDDEIRKSRSKIPVFHWSWMSILTAADLLLSSEGVADDDQQLLLNELRRFLSHESAGVKGFDRMPPEWGELNKLVSAGGRIPQRSADANAVLGAWHQETKDLSLILSRLTGTAVTEKLSRSHAKDRTEREKAEADVLRERNQLIASFDIVDAAAPLEVVADMVRRTVDVGMTLQAPEDKKSSKARVNWLLRQIKHDDISDLHVRLLWPGRSEDTQFTVAQLRDDPDQCEVGKENLQVRAFHLFHAKRLGLRLTQQANFITDLELIVPGFYRDIGQYLAQWHRPAPRIKEGKATADEVDIDAIAQDAEGASRI